MVPVVHAQVSTTTAAMNTTTTTNTTTTNTTLIPFDTLSYAASALLHPLDIAHMIYDATGGDQWNDATNWRTSTDVCSFHGVSCYPSDYAAMDAARVGHIRSLDLSDNHLVGTLPAVVFTLPYLESLVLRDNGDLTVSFREAPTILSSSASALSSSSSSAPLSAAPPFSLTKLVLSQTLVRATDLAGLQQFTSLQYLDLSGLGMTGTFPSELYQLSALVGLYANDNLFAGTLSTHIGHLFHLQVLILDNNHLSGTLPSELGNLLNLQTLSLGQNAFAGTLPEALNRLTQLQQLAIHRVRYQEKGPGLSGKLLALADLPNIVSVNFQNQLLQGPLPFNFINSASLTEPIDVDLTNNKLSGSIPASLWNKQRLTIRLADNQISPTALSTDLCQQVPDWMGGTVATLGCAAILCPEGTAAPQGRDTGSGSGSSSSTGGGTTTNNNTTANNNNATACQPCAQTTGFLGATACPLGSAGATTGSEEQTILVTFFQAMAGPYWASNTNWLATTTTTTATTTDYCTWQGIGCNANGQVVSIQLRNNDLRGSLPDSLFQLPALSILDLSSNAIQGFNFSAVGRATNLQELDLTQTDLSSFQGIGSLATTNITKLSLASNAVSGPLPTALFTLTTLQQLDISNNALTGPIPSQVGRLTQLNRLRCFGNKLTGQFPSEIGYLRNLVELLAGDNNFGGTLPSSLNNLVQLQELTLHQLNSVNGIGGPLLDLSGMQQLTSLQLAGNSLTGTLPATMLANTLRGNDRVELLLANNRLQGLIPSSWATHFADLFVDLVDNEITGYSDASLCSKQAWMDDDVGRYGCNAILCPNGTYNAVGRQTSSGSTCQPCPVAQYYGATTCGGTGGNSEIETLQTLYLATDGSNWANTLGWSTTSGDVCSWFGVSCNAAGHVISISLDSNGLAGSIPTSLFTLPALQALNLANNEISFSFNGIGSATNLRSLNLEGISLNSISGIGAAKGLEEINLTDNDLSGSLPSELLTLLNLRRLMLNYNQLTGRVPEGIAVLRNLQELYLLHNRMTGQLPAALGSLTNLKILALAENNFAGTIPPELNSLSNLEILSIQRDGGTNSSTGNVGVNQGPNQGGGPGLTGTLPSFNALTRLRSLFLGVNSLTGTIPGDFLDSITNKTAPITVDLISNQLFGEIPPALIRFEAMSLYVAGNQITSIPDSLCKQTTWMLGQVGSYSCDAILCPPNTTSIYGRQADPGSPCTPCPSGTSAQYYGSFSCGGSTYYAMIAERNILGDLWRATQGIQWIYSSGWMDFDVPVCQWYGITCNDAGTAVESINLMQNDLSGAVPTSIFGLPNLQQISFAGNNINMSFTGIASASQLQYMNLGNTGLSSLSGINNAPNLQVLNIEGNDFGDVFPTEILSLTGLTALYMSKNRLGQYMPATIANLKSLTIFECSDCAFEGNLPTTVASLSYLEYLQLGSNSFTGTLPSELSNLSKLKYLDLSSQVPPTRTPSIYPANVSNSTGTQVGFRGGLSMFGNFTQLSELYLNDNLLSGQIPDTFLMSTNASVPITIDLRYNSIEGSLPSSWQRFQNMTVDLANNKITAIPSQLCSLAWNGKTSSSTSCDFILCNKGYISGLGRATSAVPCVACPNITDSPYYGGTTCGTNLEMEILDELFFDLNGNNWVNAEGWAKGSPVCSRYGVTCYSVNGLVKTLDLHNNNLVGTVTSRIWLLTKMIELNLRQNTIDISFDLIAENEGIQTLELSETNLQSLYNIGQARSLTSLLVANNNIPGPLPDELFNLTSLKYLFLNYNKFTGTLSSSLDRLSALEELYLFSNELQGTLPDAIVRLMWIRILSLGYNKFTGTVPEEISYLPYLESLSLQAMASSTNDIFGFKSGFVGNLPPFHMNPLLRELYLGSNGFGSTIPLNFLAGVQDKTATVRVDLHDNNLVGSIPTTLTAFSDLRLDLSDNTITSIPPEICNMSNWMGGLVASGCNAILCPPGYYNQFGMRTASENCDVCTYRGAAICTCPSSYICLLEIRTSHVVYFSFLLFRRLWQHILWCYSSQPRL